MANVELPDCSCGSIDASCSCPCHDCGRHPCVCDDEHRADMCRDLHDVGFTTQEFLDGTMPTFAPAALYFRGDGSEMERAAVEYHAGLLKIRTAAKKLQRLAEKELGWSEGGGP